MSRTWSLALALLLAACASNRFASLQPGMGEDAVRAKVGREIRRIEHRDYVVHLHPGPKPGGVVFLKFREGRLDASGSVPAWSVDAGQEPPRPLNAEQYFAISVRLAGLGLKEEGFALMRRWAAENPDSSAGATLRGILFSEGDEPDSAFGVHRAAIAAAQDDKLRTEHRNNLLASYIRARRYDEGETYAQELLADPALDTAMLHGIRYNLACIYSIQNRKAKAVEQLKLAIDRRPDAFDQAFLDGDRDFDNIRTEPGFLEQRARLKPGKRRRG